VDIVQLFRFKFKICVLCPTWQERKVIDKLSYCLFLKANINVFYIFRGVPILRAAKAMFDLQK